MMLKGAVDALLFAFQLKRNTAQVAEMICPALDEDAVTHKTCKK